MSIRFSYNSTPVIVYNLTFKIYIYVYKQEKGRNIYYKYVKIPIKVGLA